MKQSIEESVHEGVEMRSTGISGLDFQLDGGFPVGTSVVVYGNPLSGLEKMAKQFWMADKTGASSYLMIDGKVEEGMTAVKDTNPASIISMMKGNWVVVDSLSTIILNNDINAAVELITNGSAETLKNDGNVFFVLYEDLHSPLEEMRIMRAVDIFVKLTDYMHGNEIERRLAIHKIPFADTPSKTFRYNLVSEGMELSTTNRVA